MGIKIPREIYAELEKISENTGFDKQKIVENALLFYLDAIKKKADLNKEFNDLDELSGEALINFENLL